MFCDTIGLGILMPSNSWSSDSEWLDLRVFPAYLTGVSAICLLIRFFIVFIETRKRMEDDCVLAQEIAQQQKDSGYVKAMGGHTVLLYKLLQVSACAVFCVASFFLCFPGHSGRDHDDLPFLVRIATITTASYVTFLSLILLVPSLSGRSSIVWALHLNLLASGLVYGWRDIWPYATYTQLPIDSDYGPVVWIFIGSNLIAGLFVPLFTPRVYRPIDPLNTFGIPAPDQRASFISLVFFAFVDPLILLGNQVSHITLDQIPPLPDHSTAAVLRKRAFKHMDQFTHKKKRHMFWGMMWFFRRSLFIQTVMLCGVALVQILSPIAMNRLLSFLETEGVGATVRPWFWIVCLLVGPIVTTLFHQWYMFDGCECIVAIESVMTQLVFEHALRIRMKAETPGDGPTKGESAELTPAPPSSEITVVGEDQDRTFISETVSTFDEGLVLDTTPTTIALDSSSVSSSHGANGVHGKDEDGGDGVGSAKGKHLIGKINNLISTDMAKIQQARDFLWGMVYAPLEFVLDLIFLYIVLGWSSIVGLVVMIALLPVPAQLSRLFHGIQEAKMEASDERVEAVSEAMSMLRMIKLFAWENHVEQKITQKRDKEMKIIWRQHMNEMMMEIINNVIPLCHMLVTFWAYTVFMKKELTASVVFSSISVFAIIRDQFDNVMGRIPKMIQAKVSFDRINDFLIDTELLDKYITSEGLPVPTSSLHDSMIGFGSGQFTWTASPSREDHILRAEEDVIFKKGRMNVIVGPTGSGKTSVLMALLGEMHFNPIGPGAWVNLPRAGGVAYAAQESWVQNETIRDNILFGAPYDDARYKKVIFQCALKPDLDLFDAGDLTEVGEKGLTLSGGQKARLTLARAVYSPADILLLDDVLAALDVHTSRWVVDKCFKGDLVRGRTVIFVTHNIALTSPIADFVATVDINGGVYSHGSPSEALIRDSTFRKQMTRETEALSKTDEPMAIDIGVLGVSATRDTASNQSGKLIVEEEVSIGRAGMRTFLIFGKSMAGRWGIFYWVTFLVCLFASQAINSSQIWWLGRWANAYESGEGVNVTSYLGVYVSLIAIGVLLYGVTVVQHVLGSIRASIMLHQKLIHSLLKSTLRWLDSTPTSRVITRCTEDFDAVDSEIVTALLSAFEITISMFVQLVAVVILTPIFVMPGVLLAFVGIKFGNHYMTAQLSMTRETSKARSPVTGHFTAAIAGLISIRAYGAEDAFKSESRSRIDIHARTARSYYNVGRWISVRLSVLSACFTAALATYMVYIGVGHDASNVGFSINMAVAFGSSIIWWTRAMNDLETEGNSLERIQQYTEIEHEAEAKAEGRPPAYWPASGQLAVENLSARYALDGPQVLKSISFTVDSGERIGIVGRTGSGKSSLTLALMRTIFTEGEVYFDGLPTSSLNLDVVRSNITIVPQVPELLSGTLRHNLDPFGQHDDATLNDVLRSSGLTSMQSETDEGRLSLDSAIASGGRNLSVGQKQILALARAMLRQSKILILDEATSAIDYETDALIQCSLRNEFKGVTLITVAHRLQTIMDSDRIMVLDEGRIVEFDHPLTLLETKGGFLYSLVNESSDRDILISMARSKASAF